MSVVLENIASSNSLRTSLLSELNLIYVLCNPKIRIFANNTPVHRNMPYSSVLAISGRIKILTYTANTIPIKFIKEAVENCLTKIVIRF
jgi:hypothetical protein